MSQILFAEYLMLSAISLLVNKFVQCTDIAPARQSSSELGSALAYSQCSQTFLSLPSLTLSGNSVSFVEKPRPFGLKNRHVSVSITDNIRPSRAQSQAGLGSAETSRMSMERSHMNRITITGSQQTVFNVFLLTVCQGSAGDQDESH